MSEVLLPDLWIAGEARPKGSLKPVGNRYGKGQGGRVRVVEQVDGSTSWLNRMTNELWRVIRVRADAVPAEGGSNWVCDEGFPITSPVAVTALFIVKPYAAEVGRGDGLPTDGRHGDLDKLMRSLGDALQKAHVVADDKLITRWVTGKRFVNPEASPERAGPGVLVRVERDVKRLGDVP